MNKAFHHKLAKDWAQYGPDVFQFEILEELEKKDEQSPERFREDIKTLKEMWLEKYEKEQLY
jgi:acyl carrier protein phosphodiesterase